MEEKQKIQSEPKIIGVAYQKPKSVTKKYAESDLPVLFVGETGSGKELFAKLYMKCSNRLGNRRTINCAALSEDLLRSEVFGHVKGAFTGAVKDRKGHLKTCADGILFLDELGDASSQFQAAILRVSEMNSFTALGSDREEPTNTLIIAATNKPQKIRTDLKMRFCIIPIPPLQKFDIPALAKSFLGKSLKADILKDLMEQEYPGNVRDLQGACKKLKARRGSDIFNKKESSFKVLGDFDYDRYEREVLTWDKHIEPLIQKYKLGFKYKYFKAVRETTIDIHDVANSMYGNVLGEKVIEKVPDMIALIDDLNMGIEETHFFYEVSKDYPITMPYGGVLHHKVPDVEPTSVSLVHIFYECMAMLFRGEGLPSFLEKITERLDRRTIPKDEKPNLSPLLDLKADDANNQFELTYLQYHLNRSSENIREAAKEIGLKLGTFKTRLSRVRERLEKSK